MDKYTAALKICLYAKWGGRKTLQGGNLIDAVGAQNVLVVNADAGLSTIESRLTVPANVIEVTSLDELRGAYNRMAAMKPHQWVFLDGGTTIHEWIADEEWAGVNEYYRLSCAKTPRDNMDPDIRPYGRFMANSGEIDSQRVYGQIGTVSKRILATIRAIPCNVYMTYREDMTGSVNRQKVPPYGPDVPGRMALNAIMAQFDYVMRLMYDDRGVLYAGADETSPEYLARTRDDWLGGIKIPKVLRGPATGEDASNGKKRTIYADWDFGTFVKLINDLRSARSAPPATPARPTNSTTKENPK